MANSNMVALKGYFNNEQVMKNLQAMLGKKAQGFVTSVLSVVNNNKLLQSVEPSSIYSSAMVAASLDLPVNPNLGFAAIVAYGRQAQLQIMTRGFVQLAIRSGEYAKITNCDVHEGELVKCDPFTDDYVFDSSKRESDKVIGYMAYIKTTSGFEKYYYMSVDDAKKHGQRYSKSYRTGVWNTDFDAMGRKTCLKMLLSKYGILSIEMQRAIKFDQGVMKGDFSEIDNIEDIDAVEVEYVDNPNSKTPNVGVATEDVNPQETLFNDNEK